MSTVSREAFEKQDAFGIGAPNDAYAQYFTGQSYFKAADHARRLSRLSGERDL